MIYTSQITGIKGVKRTMNLNYLKLDFILYDSVEIKSSDNILNLTHVFISL